MDYKAIAEWATGRSTGASATCIARHMMGLETDGSYPHDDGDFGRCEKFLNAVPECRGRLNEMAEVNKYWAALAPRWSDINAAQDKYKAIQSIVRSIENDDPNHIRLREGLSMRIGNP